MDSSMVKSKDSSKKSRIPAKALVLVAAVALVGVCLFAVFTSDEGFSTGIKTFDGMKTFDVGDCTYEGQWGMVILVKYNGDATHVEVSSNIDFEGTNYIMTGIGEGAFKNNRTLESVDIYSSFLTIGKDAFRGCTSLKQVKIFSGWNTELRDGAFQDCVSLETIQLSATVQLYGASLFENCTSLKSVVFYRNGMNEYKPIGILPTLGEDAFKNCKSLEGFDPILYVQDIPAGAFSGCTSLKFLELNDQLSTIGDYAFEGCKSMEKVVLPDSLTSIGKRSFDGCIALKEIQFGKGLTSIQEDSFMGINFFGTDGNELAVSTVNLVGSLFVGTPDRMVKQTV